MSKITETDYQEYLKLIQEGHSQRSACLILGLTRSTIQNYLKKIVKEEELDEYIKDMRKGDSCGYFDPKLSFGTSCQKMEESLQKFGKAVGGGVTEQYLELPDTEVVENNHPKICYLDIEKSFNISGHFGAWSQNLRQEAKFRESHILSYCYVFNDDEDIKGSIIPSQELKDDFINCLMEGKVHTTVDELLVLELWALFNNSDVIVAYNGRGFDVKEIQARFLMYGLPPTTPVKVIDPLLIVKDKFRLPFKSLKYVAEFLGVTQKLENNGNDLWKKATMGDEQALEDMFIYNKGDIVTLREVYKKIQGWGNSGTNLALYNDEHTSLCPHCSSDDVSSIEGKYAYTAQRKYSLFRCNSCKAILRSNRKEGNGNSLVRVV